MEPTTTQPHPHLAAASAGQPSWAPQAAALMVLPTQKLLEPGVEWSLVLKGFEHSEQGWRGPPRVRREITLLKGQHSSPPIP